MIVAGVGRSARDPAPIRRTSGGRSADDLDGLAESIREARRAPAARCGPRGKPAASEVVYGSRRRAAAIKAGLPEVPCVVVDTTPEDRLVCQMLENLQRRDLNDMDKAEGLARLRRDLARRHQEFERPPA